MVFTTLNLFLFCFIDVLQVPVEEVVPADREPEIPRSVPLPPPIIPEAEDLTLDPGSDLCGGPRSTTSADAPLDIYTLSWDLPPACDSKEDVLEFVPDEEKKMPAEEPQRTDSVQTHDSLSGSDLSPEEPSGSPSEEAAAGAEKHTKPSRSTGSELDVSEPQTEPESSSVEHLGVTAAREEAVEPSFHDETQPCDLALDGPVGSVVPQQVQPEQAASDRTPDPDLGLIPAPNKASAPQEPSAADPSDINGTSDPPSPHPTTPLHQAPPCSSAKAAPGGVPPPSSKPPPSAANPFKIQKVKSSDLRSFQQIVGQEGSKPPHVDRTSSLGSGLNLSVPTDILEMISDSEEGDEAASAVLPDWLKEGEFVTVGTNKSGTVRFLGPTDFAEGTWVGVELEVPAGDQPFLSFRPFVHQNVQLLHNVPALTFLSLFSYF